MVEKREPPFKLDMPFSEALARFAQTKPEEINISANKIMALAPKMASKEISRKGPKGGLIPLIEKDVGGIGMGVLSDGTPYLNQRGLGALCGVMNAHIGSIGAQWAEPIQKPRISLVKNVLTKAGFAIPTAPHIEIIHTGRTHFCYPAEICLAVLEYYAFDAGPNRQPEARDNFRLLAGSKLRELIFSELGYDPSGKDPRRFEKWHERIAYNYQSAPKGYFDVFNEAHTIVYELVQAGAPIGDNIVVDISIGKTWAGFWSDNYFDAEYGKRKKWPHRYPDSHPQATSNPQDSWCYPLSALGHYREWLQDTYIEGGKFAHYLKGKVARGELSPSVAQLAISIIVPPQIEGPTC